MKKHRRGCTFGGVLLLLCGLLRLLRDAANIGFTVLQPGIVAANGCIKINVNVKQDVANHCQHCTDTGIICAGLLCTLLPLVAHIGRTEVAFNQSVLRTAFPVLSICLAIMLSSSCVIVAQFATR